MLVSFCRCRVRDSGAPGRAVRDRGQSGHVGMLHGREPAGGVLPVPHARPARLRRGRAAVRAPAVPVHVLRPRPDGRPLRSDHRPRGRLRLRQLDVRRQDTRLVRIRGSQHDHRVEETRR